MSHKGFGYEPHVFGYEAQVFGYEPHGFGYEPQGFGYEPQGFGYCHSLSGCFWCGSFLGAGKFKA